MPIQPKSDICQERLHQLFVYDEQTGIFTRRISRRCAKAGSVAGCRSTDGYWQISISGSVYRAHRLAWLYAHGTWPTNQIDHIDGNRLNNRITNLRDVPQSTNMLNIHAPGSANTTGFRGVFFDRNSGTFSYSVRVKGRDGVGSGFKDAMTAHQGYLLRKEIMIGEARQ